MGIDAAVVFGNYTEKCSANHLGVDCYREWYNGRGYVLRNEYRGCEYSDILLPGFELLPQPLLAVVYFAFLLYLFFAVNLATEYFMRGVEQVAYAGYEKTIRDPGTGEDIKVRVTYWNEQVSTLSLIAAGSSAPEIVLATIGAIFTLGEAPDELGPGTIMGTAAYNSLVITAAVLLCVPKGKPKKIFEVTAYLWTAVMAIWTYIWLMLVYKFISPNQIELWEAILTFMFQPILVVGAYLIDRQPWKLNTDQYYLKTHRKMNAPQINIAKVEMFNSQGQTFVADKTKLASMLREAKEKDPGFDEDTFVEEFLDKVSNSERAMARLKARISARHMFGGGLPFMKKFGLDYLSPVHVSVHPEPDKEPTQQYIGFSRASYSCLESQGLVRLAVKRSGARLNQPSAIGFYTKDATAVAGSDYTSNLGNVVFGEGETLQYITVSIIDDHINEPDKDFTVHLVAPKPAGLVVLGQQTAVVTIIDNDDPGIVGFLLPDVEVTTLDTSVTVEVTRRAGASGEIAVDYFTTDSQALAGKDYEASSGHLEFEHGEVTKAIKIPIRTSMRPGVAFIIDLVNPTGGAKLGITQCKVHVDEHPAVGAVAKKIAQGYMSVRERVNESANDYATQFREALNPGTGGGEDETQIGWTQLILHYICSTIKLILACLPPPRWGGGYPCLILGLVFIGGFTYLMGQAASLFGCSIGFSNYLTAVIFVAAGTSLPDTFASIIAIRDLPNADPALGNITGSNAVNVFVGLGLPWLIASSYYTYKGQPYITPAKSLAFNVVIFNIVNLIATVAILAQRWFTGYEVNDSFFSRRVLPIFFMVLLALYLLLAGLENKGNITGF